MRYDDLCLASIGMMIPTKKKFTKKCSYFSLSLFTSPFSFSCPNITIAHDSFSHIILQKSAQVDSMGPGPTKNSLL